MIRDRGHKKWVSLMLPQHRSFLRQWTQQPPPSPPQWDEQMQEAIHTALQEAVRCKKQVQIHYWKEGRAIVLCGRLSLTHSPELPLQLTDGRGNWHKLHPANILHLEEGPCDPDSG